MLSEIEVRNLKKMYEGRIEAIVDPTEKQAYHISIIVLEMVLNE